jgi:hypothetical protein
MLIFAVKLHIQTSGSGMSDDHLVFTPKQPEP